MDAADGDAIDVADATTDVSSAADASHVADATYAIFYAAWDRLPYG